jgi:hypothetical protein
MTHDEIRVEIAGYAMGRVGPEIGREIEEHVVECEPCAGALAAARRLTTAIGSEGAAADSDHPAPLALRALALGEKLPDRAALVRHLAACDTCALDAAAWRARGAAVAHGQPAAARRAARWIAPAAGVAAGLLLGLLLGIRSGPRTPPPLEPRPSTIVDLSNALRGDDAVPVLALERAAENVRLRVSVEALEDPRRVGPLEFRILDPAQSTVYLTIFDADAVASVLGRHEPFELPVAASVFRPGLYELRVLKPGDAASAPLVLRRFEAHLQSPEATKAPQ